MLTPVLLDCRSHAINPPLLENKCHARGVFSNADDVYGSLGAARIRRSQGNKQSHEE